MKSQIRKLFSRFRKAPYDPRHTRTMAQSQLEDQQAQNTEPEEWKAFNDKSFEKGQEALHEEDSKTHH